ncbi:MAG: phosphoribosylformylglycinamidine cyclo-ligase [Lachnospiraceae bacterium]|jgi:phosphoribosylformylglycinamidine cyclo-ligase|nr:phosphoribosylformylglycinamidine cyclo-ligase [Lachnospiraceae bacterium]
MDYKAAGVDVTAGYRSVELIKDYVKDTFRPEVVGGFGGFGGAFSLKKIKEMENPVLISATDGVGTKLKLAFLLDQHGTVGIDCVAMCVNDIICVGAEPLYFLDYIACGHNTPTKIAEIVKGVADGCKMAGAALIGGETAEHPGMIPAEEYDLAGFAVGVVEEGQMITGADIAVGDVLIGLASSGVHSNGFSLIRKVFAIDDYEFDTENLDINEEVTIAVNNHESAALATLAEYYDELDATLGEALLTPTKIYVKTLESVKKSGVTIKGCVNITGGGFDENVPRMLPKGVTAVIEKNSYQVPAIFSMIKESGDISEAVMYNTFNMGLGMIFAVDKSEVEQALAAVAAVGDCAYVVGHIEKGSTDAEGNLCLR